MEKAYACWHTPILGAECPHCRGWNDLQKQNEDDHEWYFEPMKSYSEEVCKDVEFECDDCNEKFELQSIEY